MRWISDTLLLSGVAFSALREGDGLITDKILDTTGLEVTR